MTTTIAFAGKGGVGKTTLSALTIRYLAGLKAGPVLAVDADPSSNLNLLLGLELDATVSELREDMLEQVKQTLTQGGAAMGTLPGGLVLTARTVIFALVVGFGPAESAARCRHVAAAVSVFQGTRCFLRVARVRSGVGGDALFSAAAAAGRSGKTKPESSRSRLASALR